MKKPFKIKEVKPGIFLFEFDSNYDMCMHFLRYQEFYESCNPKFRGKKFTILEFMKWYSSEFGGNNFTYPTDWIGFNIPGDIISRVWSLGLPDQNDYDKTMLFAWNKCLKKAKGKFYIIGAVKGNVQALNHEIAHGLFYLNTQYKKETTALVKALDPKIKKDMKKVLKSIGYTPKVYVDEMQAYMSTGLGATFGNPLLWLDEQEKFKKVFNRYSK